MGREAGVIDDPLVFPYTPPGVDVLEGGKLTSNNVAGSLQSFVVASGAVSKPGGGAAGQDALQCRCTMFGGCWGSFQTSSAFSARMCADVSSSALHLCERTR